VAKNILSPKKWPKIILSPKKWPKIISQNWFETFILDRVANFFGYLRMLFFKCPKWRIEKWFAQNRQIWSPWSSSTHTPKSPLGSVTRFEKINPKI
jgi:hypothetical protein